MVFENIPYFVNLKSYLRAAVVFFIVFLALRILLFIAEKIFLKFTLKTKTDIDDIILKKSSKPLNFISLLIGLSLGLNEIVFTSELIKNIINHSVYSLVAISIGYLIFTIVDISLTRIWKKISEKTESNIDDAIGNLVHEILRIVLIVLIV